MSFSPETIKEHRAALIKLVLALSVIALFFLLGRANKENIGTRAIPDVEVKKELLVLNKIEGKWYYQGVPFGGYAIQTNDTGQLIEKIGFVNGKRQGLALKWHSNGLISSEKYYQENRLEGTTKTWWPNGQQSTESNYSNRQRHGIQKKWYPSGQIARIMRFNQGKEEGLQQAWLQTGKLYANYEAKNGRFFGLKRSNLCYQLEDEVVQK
ncbi:toxin-antitoxin system YwqK family antitoxin [Flagellimonas sp.]|uniref:toxin-antitoxin system YwqK family antitoxin n=1 Tax=Flagellimonas sp. TaxID=2058762 RepID=UPI003F4A27BD